MVADTVAADIVAAVGVAEHVEVVVAVGSASYWLPPFWQAAASPDQAFRGLPLPCLVGSNRKARSNMRRGNRCSRCP